jgi:SAM-dependent methyltransferase
VEPTEQNRRAWDEVHRRRSESLAGELDLPAFVRERLPGLDGLRVLHLQCATGESTAELAGLGALVTGVDISSEALAVARERDPAIAWVQADVHALPTELRRGRFDLVFSGGGVLAWLLDLDAWAAGIAAALREDGELFLYDDHPVAVCVDESLHWREDYFDESVFVDVGWRHFRLSGPEAREEKHERHWRLGQIVTAVADAGLVVRSLEELPLERLWRPQDARVPGAFVLRADKTDA